MQFNAEHLWAGTEASFHAAMEAETRAADARAAGIVKSGDRDDNRLLNVENGIATISIKGSLNNRDDSWYNEYMGATGYPEIRDALITAATDPEVKSILLDINSGGGAVAGVADTGKLIRKIADEVKPVTAYADGTMLSAAYWLGSSASQVFASKSTVAGSIGVLSIHMERSKMLADAGIGVTVVRSGKFKALANSVEKLTAEGEKQLQQVVDASNQVFVEHVAEMRNTTAAKVEANMGQGREFLGEAALKAGLIDGITSFDDLMSAISTNLIDASNSSMHNRAHPQSRFISESAANISGEPEMSQKALTAQQIAALAAGAGASPAASAAVETPTPAPVAAAPTQEQPVAAPAPVASSADAAVVAEVATLKATVQLLTEQNASKDAAILQANVNLAQVNAEVASLKASIEPMSAIVAKSIGNMQVALGGTALDAKGMTPTQLLAEHGRIEATFASKFPVGGVAAAAAPTESPASPVVTALQAALFQSAAAARK